MNIVKEIESESMKTRVVLHPFLAISFLKDDCALRRICDSPNVILPTI